MSTRTLNQEVASGSVQAKQTLAALQRALDAATAILQNPNVLDALEHLDGISENVEEITGEVEQILRPWTKNQGLLRRVLSLVLGLLRMDISTLANIMR